MLLRTQMNYWNLFENNIKINTDSNTKLNLKFRPIPLPSIATVMQINQ